MLIRGLREGWLLSCHINNQEIRRPCRFSHPQPEPPPSKAFGPVLGLRVLFLHAARRWFLPFCGAVAQYLKDRRSRMRMLCDGETRVEVFQRRSRTLDKALAGQLADGESERSGMEAG